MLHTSRFEAFDIAAISAGLEHRLAVLGGNSRADRVGRLGAHALFRVIDQNISEDIFDNPDFQHGASNLTARPAAIIGGCGGE